MFAVRYIYMRDLYISVHCTLMMACVRARYISDFHYRALLPPAEYFKFNSEHRMVAFAAFGVVNF